MPPNNILDSYHLASCISNSLKIMNIIGNHAYDKQGETFLNPALLSI